jgi:photosystem I subunit X
MHSIFLATVPPTPEWSFATALVMIVCNVIGLALAAFKTQGGSKPASPVPGLGFPQLLAGTAFGHVLGAGAILGLTNMGVL